MNDTIKNILKLSINIDNYTMKPIILDHVDDVKDGMFRLEDQICRMDDAIDLISTYYPDIHNTSMSVPIVDRGLNDPETKALMYLLSSPLTTETTRATMLANEYVTRLIHNRYQNLVIHRRKLKEQGLTVVDLLRVAGV